MWHEIARMTHKQFHDFIALHGGKSWNGQN